jgi:hypothetical protein
VRFRQAAALVAVLALATVCGAAASGPVLIQPADLVYQGAFKLPLGSVERKSFFYGGTAIAFNSGRPSLFVVGHDWYQRTAEVTIPALVKTTTVASLKRAGMVQGFADATGGTINQTGGTTKIGGQLVYQGRLYGTAYLYYDAAGTQVASHWTRSGTSLTGGSAAGLFRVGRVGAGFVSGYMGAIPAEWQARLGGPGLTGNCCIPIIGRTSLGPAAFAFDPAKVGQVDPVPAQKLVYYPIDHPTIGKWDDSWNPAAGIVFNGTTTVRGVVFPAGTGSVLFFGTQGTGTFCYGTGTDDPSLVGKDTGDGALYCYDPDNSSKGTHAWPYRAEVWAYDVNNLLSVREGHLRPWAIRPYATWRLDLPFGSPTIGGATYDPTSGRIYVSQQFGDGTNPVIHAFTLR